MCDVFREQRGVQGLQRMLHLGEATGKTQTKKDFICSSEAPGSKPLEKGFPQQ